MVAPGPEIQCISLWCYWMNVECGPLRPSPNLTFCSQINFEDAMYKSNQCLVIRRKGVHNCRTLGQSVCSIKGPVPSVALCLSFLPVIVKDVACWKDSAVRPALRLSFALVSDLQGPYFLQPAVLDRPDVGASSQQVLLVPNSHMNAKSRRKHIRQIESRALMN
jgi:hypothetical protein